MSDKFLFVKTGDIILTRSHTLSGRINATYQRLRRSRSVSNELKFIPTHAALALDRKSIIHSNKQGTKIRGRAVALLRAVYQLLVELLFSGSDAAREHSARRKFGYGVSVDSLGALLQNIEAQDVLLLRHPKLAGLNPDLFSRLFQESLYHIDMPYNLLVEISEGKGTAVFCSQLVYQVFEATGIDVPSGKAHRVLPVDILNWAKQNDWTIVSGKEVFNALAQSSDSSTDGSTSVDMAAIVMRTVESHRAAVEHIRQMQATTAIFSTFNQKAAEFVSGLPPVRFSADEWMQIGAEPVPISVKGLLIAIDDLAQSAGKPNSPALRPVAEDPATTQPNDHPARAKPISWLLRRPVRTKVGSAKAKEITANRLIDFANEILGELDNSAQETLSVLKSLAVEVGHESLAEDLKRQFIGSLALKRFLFVARFVSHSGSRDALDAQFADITRRESSLTDEIREYKETFELLNASGETKQKISPEDNAAIIGRIRLVKLHAIVSDFASAAQWLNVYAGDLSLQDMFEYLVDHDYPALVECFESLSNLQKNRIIAAQIEGLLHGN